MEIQGEINMKKKEQASPLTRNDSKFTRMGIKFVFGLLQN